MLHILKYFKILLVQKHRLMLFFLAFHVGFEVNVISGDVKLTSNMKQFDIHSKAN